MKTILSKQGVSKRHIPKEWGIEFIEEVKSPQYFENKLAQNKYLDSNRMYDFNRIQNDINIISNILNSSRKISVIHRFGNNIQNTINQAEEAIQYGIKRDLFSVEDYKNLCSTIKNVRSCLKEDEIKWGEA